MNVPLPRLTPTHWAWVVALGCAVAPLFASRALPLVDLPQHLHLISVLHRLDDASTLYPEVFERRVQLTPYLGYYYLVSWLSWLLPLELANRLFLALYVAGLPLSLAFLLESLRRPTWPALLAIPFAYGDSFAWGFLNYCSALPLAFITCGLFVRAIEDARRRKAWSAGLSVALVGVLLFHVQVFGWLALALPFLLATTPAPEGRSVKARSAALVGVVPGVLLFIAWVGLRIGEPAEIAPGQPWRSWGPMLSPQNLGWKSFSQNKQEFLPMLGNLLPDGGDQLAVKLAFGLALLAVGLALFTSKRTGGRVPFNVRVAVFLALGLSFWRLTLVEPPPGAAGGPSALEVGALIGLAAVVVGLLAIASPGAEHHEGPIARWRIVGLAALGVVLLFALPFDIRGYMYYLNTRYVHLAAALLVVCVPPLAKAWADRAVWAGVALAALTAWPLVKGFRAFDVESRALTELASSAGERPRTMGIIFATGSSTMTHPVYLHASTVIARERGGLTNFSFALTPHSPLKYRGTPPPTFPSEWDPSQWASVAGSYDHFVLRGYHPREVLGPRLESEFFIADQRGDFFLVRRR